MFTGLVQHLAEVVQLAPEPGGVRIVICAAELARTAELGASIAVNGVCLTVVAVEGELLSFQAGEETLSRTNLGGLKPADRVNLEGSLRMGDEIGGHLVTGHIDGLATLDSRVDNAEWATFWFQVPGNLTRQMASKGSVTVDGVSLTLVDVEADRFSVALIPHTLSVTTLGARKLGDSVNIETDILAKYVERQLPFQSDDS